MNKKSYAVFLKYTKLKFGLNAGRWKDIKSWLLYWNRIRLKQNQQQVTQTNFCFHQYFVYLSIENIIKKTMLLLFMEKCVSKLNQLQRTRTPQIIKKLKRKSPESTTPSFEIDSISPLL